MSLVARVQPDDDFTSSNLEVLPPYGRSCTVDVRDANGCTESITIEIPAISGMCIIII